WVCAANPIETNRWYHYAVTYDAATLELRIFMNGALERVVPMPNGLSLGRQLQVGGDLHSDNWINRFVDAAAFRVLIKEGTTDKEGPDSLGPFTGNLPVHKTGLGC
ncbi:MAG: hypothetical protein HYZ75_02630, partial [Elusimicrobia bacterium]|nr:hypothetical protein [Elusimicrobiota bacterium]